jgi:hypothetical protein
MKEQNFKNHIRFVPLFHLGLTLTVLAMFVLSIINLFSGISLLSAMFFLTAVALVLMFVFIRNFPIAVQDRAIRAEENLRYFVLTGKLLDSRLTIQQIIALRFAADEELIALAERAVKENLSNKDIKKAVKNWRADHHRA